MSDVGKVSGGGGVGGLGKLFSDLKAVLSQIFGGEQSAQYRDAGLEMSPKLASASELTIDQQNMLARVKKPEDRAYLLEGWARADAKLAKIPLTQDETNILSRITDKDTRKAREYDMKMAKIPLTAEDENILSRITDKHERWMAEGQIKLDKIP